MIFLYTLFFYLSLPLVFLRLWWRGRRNTMYRDRWAERLGWPAFRLESSIWLHAVSMGEAVAATGLVEALLARFPEYPIVLTSMTPTGSQHMQKLVQKWPGRVFHSYVPYDLPLCLNSFIGRISPKLLIVMETELWPNVFRLMQAQKRPVVVVNARISDRAYRRYQKIARQMSTILGGITWLAAQSEQDRERFVHLGMDPHTAETIGNMKYDLSVSETLPAQAAVLKAGWAARFVVIAASTHEGEEAAFLAAYAALKPGYPALLLMLVPRHPERFQKVAEDVKTRGLTLIKRSEATPVTSTTDVFLGDSMGELMLFYACADIAFVGGSLVPVGGHNILEPAALHLPILFGPYMQNSRKIVADFLKEKAACATSAEALSKDLAILIEDAEKRQALGERAGKILAANRGVVAQLVKKMEMWV